MNCQISNEDAKQFIERLDAAAILDKTGAYIYASPAWCQVAEQKVEDVIGKKVWDVVPKSPARRVLETGVPVFSEPVSLKSENGVIAFFNYLPRYAKDGSLNGCYIIMVAKLSAAQNISERLYQLNNQVEFYRQELSKERGARYGLDSIIGASPAIVRVKEQIMQAARSSSTVLIEGETGCGKELIAHAIHSLSSRRDNNFVRVNCSAIPPELMESEFFGYASGAFTGASTKGKEGRFTLANGGSIFLDEIDLLSKTMQPKFLRVLQEREIELVGGGKSVPVNVRVIAATNSSLEQAVERGDFRRDLYYRLNVIRIVAPTLRSRKEDIPLLVENLIKRLNYQLGMVVRDINSATMELLMSYDWPGNVRELQNAIENAMNMNTSGILCLGDFEQLVNRIQAKQLSSDIAKGGKRFKDFRSDFERQFIKEVLLSVDGNKVKAAKALGVSRSVLYQKLDQYNIN